MTLVPCVVLDTSTLVSAASRPGSLPSAALRIALARFQVVTSEYTAQELQDVLGRDKFDRYLSRSDRALFVGLIHRHAHRLDVAEEHLQAASRCPDPKDAPFLGLALSAGARYLVSSDADLLGMHPFMGNEVLSSGAFVRLHGR